MKCACKCHTEYAVENCSLAQGHECCDLKWVKFEVDNDLVLKKIDQDYQNVMIISVNQANRLTMLELSNKALCDRVSKLELDIKLAQQNPVIDSSQECPCKYDKSQDCECGCHPALEKCGDCCRIWNKKTKTYWVNVYRNADGKIITAIDTYESEEVCNNAAWKNNPAVKFMKAACFELECEDETNQKC